MKMLFIHDNRFWSYGQQVYSYGHFAYDLMWKRYLNYFDEIEVGGRIRECDDVREMDNLSVSSGPHVSFFSLPDLMNAKGLTKLGQARRILTQRITQADCVVIRLPSNLGYLACGLARKLHKQYAVEVVGCTWDDLWNYGTAAGKLYAGVSYLLQRRCVAKAPNVLYVSRHFLQRRYPNRRFHLGCPDTNISLSEPSVLERRKQRIRTMGGTTVRLGLIASLNVGYKGHDTAIYALKEVLRRHENVELCFLGDGKPDRWQALAEGCGVSDHVIFCGALPGGAPVLEWIDGIDILLVPSLQETLGRALIEGMSRGCPALGGAGTAVPEQLGDDCIHGRKNYHQLAEMICYMLEHPEYMELCAAENFERAKKYSEQMLQQRRDWFWEKVTGADREKKEKQ